VSSNHPAWFLAVAVGLAAAGCGSPTAPSGLPDAAGRGAADAGAASTASVPLALERLSPSSPSSSPSPGAGETELRGTVTAVAPPDLTLDDRTVRTTSSTEIKRGNARIGVGEIEVGETAKVEGALQPDGSVLAREIELGPQDGADDGDAVEFEGPIESITPPDLQVAGRVVTTDAETKIVRGDRRIGLADLQVGESVEVKAVVRAGALLARKIKVHDGNDDHGDDNLGDDDHEDDHHGEDHHGDDDHGDDDHGDDHGGQGGGDDDGR
jgi:Domain of unknown function (DUF5666)